jgi:hypothetical protein
MLRALVWRFRLERPGLLPLTFFSFLPVPDAAPGWVVDTGLLEVTPGAGLIWEGGQRQCWRVHSERHGTQFVADALQAGVVRFVEPQIEEPGDLVLSPDGKQVNVTMDVAHFSDLLNRAIGSLELSMRGPEAVRTYDAAVKLEQQLRAALLSPVLPEVSHG